MTVCVRAGFDKVLPAQAMECADKTGRHGMVHGPNRSPWRVRNRLHAGSGRFPRPVWRLETPTASRLPVRFRAGILRASLMRPQSAGFRNGVRRASGAPDAGSSSSHAVGAPVNTPSRARDGVAHPPSSGRSSLSRRVRLLPSPPGDGGNSRPTGCGNGLRRRPRSSRRIMQRGVGLFPAHCRPRRDDRGGAGRCVPSHPRGGRASPSCRDRLAA